MIPLIYGLLDFQLMVGEVVDVLEDEVVDAGRVLVDAGRILVDAGEVIDISLVIILYMNEFFI